MKRICLAIPTNRECSAAIAALVQEAAYAVQHFPVQVVVLIADTAPAAIADSNARALREAVQALHGKPADTGPGDLNTEDIKPDEPVEPDEPVCGDTRGVAPGGIEHPPPAPAIRSRIEAHHLNQAHQAALLARIIARAELAGNKPEREIHGQLIQDLLLPAGVSYGAATNRLFLLAAYWDCDSLHRRDSDSRYQHSENGTAIYPIHQELRCIGLPASAAATLADRVAATPLHPDCPVMLAGASYIGALSIDVAPMFARDADAAYRIVGQFAPSHLSAAEKRTWVDCSYLHTGQQRFVQDQSELAHGHSFLIDTCNICFSQIQYVLPLPPACDTVGTDYFLLSLMNILALPVVHHNRHIENFHTPERRSAQGFVDYQFRLVKYFLYMSWLHATVRALDAAKQRLWLAPPGAKLAWNLPLLHALLAEPVPLAQIDAENATKLAELQQQYTRLGGEYAGFAALLAEQAASLLQACRNDIASYATFAPHWPALMRAARPCFDGDTACRQI